MVYMALWALKFQNGDRMASCIYIYICANTNNFSLLSVRNGRTSIFLQIIYRNFTLYVFDCAYLIQVYSNCAHLYEVENWELVAGQACDPSSTRAVDIGLIQAFDAVPHLHGADVTTVVALACLVMLVLVL